jgi:hypothetical protein
MRGHHVDVAQAVALVLDAPSPARRIYSSGEISKGARAPYPPWKTLSQRLVKLRDRGERLEHRSRSIHEGPTVPLPAKPLGSIGGSVSKERNNVGPRPRRGA